MSAATYPLGGAMAAATLAGLLASNRPDHEVAAILSSQAPATWANVLPDATAPTSFGAVVRLAVNQGARLLNAGPALVHTGDFDQLCKTAGVDPAILHGPRVAWLLASATPHPLLGFSAGAAGAAAAIAAACIASNAASSAGPPPTGPIHLWGPDEQLVDLAAAGKAAAEMPSAWVAAAELFGACAALDTWAPTRAAGVPAPQLLAALYPDDSITAGPPDASSHPRWWQVQGRLRYSISATTSGRARWVEQPARRHH